MYADTKAYLCGDVPGSSIFSHGWDLVLPAVTALEKESDAGSNEGVALCEDVLREVVRRGNPKEVMVSLLEHLALVKSSGGFELVLECFQELLRKLPGNKVKFLEWGLESFYGYVARLPNPENHNLEDEEVALLDADPAVRKISRSLEAMTTLLASCVNSAARGGQATTPGCGQATVEQQLLLKYSIKFLGRVSVLDITSHPNKAKSAVRLCTEKLVNQITKLSKDLVVLCLHKVTELKDHELAHEDDKDEKEFVAPISRAVLAYLIFVECLEPDHVPLVYSSRYLFEENLKGILLLLSENYGVVVSKGVALSACLVSRLEFCQYCSLDLDNSDFTALFLCLNKVEKHAGLCGFLLDLFRKDLHESLVAVVPNNPFVGNNFVQLLKLVCKLPEQEHTDLLDNSDCILAVLNLLRYFATVMQQHAQDNPTTCLSVCTIAEAYTEDVKKFLDLTRAHYKLELDRNKDRVKMSSRPANSTSLSKGDSLFPSLPPDQEAEVLKVALVRLDLLES
ncbi:glomulin, partial [Ixodes scapularis]